MSCCRDVVSLPELEKLLFISSFEAVIKLKDSGLAENDFMMSIIPVFVVISLESVQKAFRVQLKAEPSEIRISFETQVIPILSLLNVRKTFPCFSSSFPIAFSSLLELVY